MEEPCVEVGGKGDSEEPKRDREQGTRRPIVTPRQDHTARHPP